MRPLPPLTVLVSFLGLLAVLTVLWSWNIVPAPLRIHGFGSPLARPRFWLRAITSVSLVALWLGWAFLPAEDASTSE